MLTQLTPDRADFDAFRQAPRPPMPPGLPRDSRGSAYPYPSCVPMGGHVDASAVLLRKLARFNALSQSDQQYLRAAIGAARWRSADSNLVEQGRPTDHVSVIVSGLACRYKMLPEGRRQILGFLLPGDLCDAHFLASNVPDHSVALLTKSLVVRIPLAKLSLILGQCPDIARAVQLGSLIDNAIAREWLVSAGQRSAIEKLAHLFCELHERYAAIGGIDADGSFALFINQSALADCTGLSPVHVNRTLKQLRDMGLVVLRQRRLMLTKLDQLRGLADFDGHYLNVRHR